MRNDRVAQDGRPLQTGTVAVHSTSFPRASVLPEERRRVPAGLAVFTVGRNYASELEAAGLRLVPATAPLARVE